MFRSFANLLSDLSRDQAQPVVALPELEAQELALVSGGLPRVGGAVDAGANDGSNNLPRVG